MTLEIKSPGKGAAAAWDGAVKGSLLNATMSTRCLGRGSGDLMTLYLQYGRKAGHGTSVEIAGWTGGLCEGGCGSLDVEIVTIGQGVREGSGGLGG